MRTDIQKGYLKRIRQKVFVTSLLFTINGISQTSLATQFSAQLIDQQVPHSH